MDISAYLASVQDNPQSAALARNVTQPGIPSADGSAPPAGGGPGGSWADVARQDTGPVTSGGFDQTQMGGGAIPNAGFSDHNLSQGMNSAQDYTSDDNSSEFAGGGSVAALGQLAATIPVIRTHAIAGGGGSSAKPSKDEPKKPNNPGPRKRPEEEALRHNQKQNSKDTRDPTSRPADKPAGEEATDGDHEPDGSEGGSEGSSGGFNDYGLGGDETWGNHGGADSGEYEGSTYGGDYDTGYSNPGATQDYGGLGAGGGGDAGDGGGGGYEGGGGDGGDGGGGGYGGDMGAGGGFDVGGFGEGGGGGEYAEGGEVGGDDADDRGGSSDNDSDDQYAQLPSSENVDDRRRDVITPQQYAGMSAHEQAMASNYPGGPGDDMLAGSKRILKGPQRYDAGGGVNGGGGADVRTAVAAAMDYGYKKHAVNPGVPDPLQGQRVKEMLSNRDATPPHQAHAAIAAAGGNSGQAVADVFNFYNKQGRGQPKKFEEGGEVAEYGSPPPVEETERGEYMPGEMDAEPKGFRERVGDAIGMRGPEVQKAPPAIPPQEGSEPPTKRKGGMEALGGLGLSETGAQEIGAGSTLDAIGNGAAAAWGMVRAIGETWNKASALARAANDQGNPPKAAEIMGHALSEGVPDGEKVHVTAGPDGYKVNTSDGGTMTLTPQQFDTVAKTPFDVMAHQGVSHALQKVAEVPTSVNMQQAEAVRGRMVQQDQGQPQPLPQRSQAAQALARTNPQRGQWPDGAPFGQAQQQGNNEPIRVIDGRTGQPTPANGGPQGATGRAPPQPQGGRGPINIIDGRTGQNTAIYDPDKNGAYRARPMVSEKERMGQANNKMHENVARMNVEGRGNVAQQTNQSREGIAQSNRQSIERSNLQTARIRAGLDPETGTQVVGDPSGRAATAQSNHVKNVENLVKAWRDDNMGKATPAQVNAFREQTIKDYNRAYGTKLGGQQGEQPQSRGPQPGQVVNGKTFLGGNPNDRNSWR